MRPSKFAQSANAVGTALGSAGVVMKETNLASKNVAFSKPESSQAVSMSESRIARKTAAPESAQSGAVSGSRLDHKKMAAKIRDTEAENGMSEYEMQREERIRKNQEVLANLGIDTVNRSMEQNAK